MIRGLANYLAGVPPVFIDGLLYALVALFAFLQNQFGSDDAAKFISPVVLFWLKTAVGSMGAAVLSIKLYRSTAFAEHQAQKKIETSFMNRPAP